MNREDHHLLCLGLLAKIWKQAARPTDITNLTREDKQAIVEAIDCAESIGLPVSGAQELTMTHREQQRICTSHDHP